MNRWVKRVGWSLVVLLVLGGLVAMAGKVLGERKRARIVNVEVQGVDWALDAPSLERGRYLFASRGCAECHGKDGAGQEFINDGHGMRVAGPNITPGSPVARYSTKDWERVIRHGVKADGHVAFIMPSEDYNRFTNQDLAALVGYLRTLPSRSGGDTIIELPLPVLALYGFGAIQDAFEKIDHSLAPAQPVAEAVNPQHGAYVANMCIGCHGPGFSGGKIPGAPPTWPPAANLTPGEGSALARYPDVASFMAMLRAGKRADGSAIQVMPFSSLRELSETDMQAVYAYLKTVPARPPGQR